MSSPNNRGLHPTNPLSRLFGDFHMGSLSRKTTVVALSKFSQFFFVLLANAILARALLTNEFGRYQQVWLLINTLIPALLLGVPQGINYFVPQSDPERARKIVWQFYVLLMLVAAPITLALFLFPTVGSALLHNPDTTDLVRISAFYILLMLPTYCLDSILIINNKHWLLFVITAVWSALFFLINLYFGLARNLEMIFIALACLAALKLLLTLAVTWRDLGSVRGFFDSALFREVFNYALVLGAVGFVDVISVQIDKFLVTILTRSEEAFAIYVIGAYEIPLIPLIIASVTAVAMPEFSRQMRHQDRAQVMQLFHNTVKKLSLFIFPLFAYLAATADTIVPLLFSQKFTASVPIFLIYLLLLPVRTMNNYPLLIAAGMQGWVLIGRILDVLISIVLGIVFLSWFGLVGAAMAIVVATYAEKAYQSILLMRRFKVSVADLYPWGFMVRWLFAAAVCTLPLLLMRTVTSRYIAFAAGTLLFACIYFVLLDRWYRAKPQRT